MLDQARKIFEAAASQREYTLRFAVIGVLAASVHFLSLWLMLAFTTLAPLLANMVAYSIALSLSFLGHFKWTFKCEQGAIKAFFKFILVSFGAFSLNTCVLLAMLVMGWFAPLFAAFIAFLFGSAFMFLASRHWAFHQRN
jgi:putative flippase GtrA